MYWEGGERKWNFEKYKNFFKTVNHQCKHHKNRGAINSFCTKILLQLHRFALKKNMRIPQIPRDLYGYKWKCSFAIYRTATIELSSSAIQWRRKHNYPKIVCICRQCATFIFGIAFNTLCLLPHILAGKGILMCLLY